MYVLSPGGLEMVRVEITALAVQVFAQMLRLNCFFKSPLFLFHTKLCVGDLNLMCMVQSRVG